MPAESSSYGLSRWPSQSPSATPKTTAGPRRQFDSPATGSPSIVIDAYYTPSIKNHPTPALTPDSGSTSVDRTRHSKPLPLTPHDPHFHANISSSSALPLPPVEPAKRLSSSPNPEASGSRFTNVGLQVNPSSDQVMDPFNLHTPPPGEAQRQASMQHAHTVHGQSYSHAQNQMSTPLRQQTPNFPAQNLQVPAYQTPFNHHLSVAADLYQYPNGPASAPPVPQGRFMWDHSPQAPNFDGHTMPLNQSQLGHADNAMPHWQMPQASPHSLHDGFSQQPLGMPQTADSTDFWLSSGLPSQQPMNNFSTDTSFMQPDATLKSNVMFSFTSPPQTIDPSSTGPLFSQCHGDSARQPYEQQVKASTQEREAIKKNRQLHLLTSQNRSGASLTPTSRPFLSRSNTDSGFRRSRIKITDPKTTLQTGEGLSRRDSLLKRNSQATLNAIPETSSRTSKLRTRLIIDASGTARTETVASTDSSVWNRRKSSSLLDDDSSEEDPILSSQRNSFILGSDLLRPSKHGRNDSDDEDGGLYKRPLSTASLSSLTNRFGATPLSNRASVDTRQTSQDYASFLSKLASSAQGTEFGHDGDSDAGDAQSALKRLVGDRSRRDPSDPNATIKPRRAATNPNRASNMFDITRFPSQRSPSATFDGPSNTNTPNTERSLQLGDCTRCVCGTVEEGGASPVVQCENCTNYLHVRCVFGKRAEERGVKLPKSYVCAFCTGQVRGPSASLRPGHFHGHDSGFGTSPLGHKSGSFFG